jgi:pyruvate/2-oxoglutarate dehydrogenase complex dihydrolipoamide dehydrogenase (E3) component
MRLLVLGGGPAGLNAAPQGRELGAQVILRVADYAHHGRRLSGYVAATGIELVEGTGPARFVEPYTVAVGDGRSWQADRIIVAVGGHPGRLPIPGAELALTDIDLRALTALPGRIAVIGGADTGCQLASSLADFGCQTLLLEYAPRLIPRADQDLSAALDAAFTRRGIEVVTGASAERLVRVEGGVEVQYRQANGPARRLVDAVFFAVGCLGEYSAEVIQVAAVAMAANLRVEQLAELQLAFPTFTEALGMAAQQLVRELGVAHMPPSPSDLAPASLQGGKHREK